MKCRECGAEVFTVDSRPKGDLIRRRKQCGTCGARFSTIEIREEEFKVLNSLRMAIWECVDLNGKDPKGE